MTDEQRQWDRLLPILVLCAGWIYTGLYFDCGLDAFDAGLFATEAERVTAGGVYGKDFLAPYGPGRYYVVALLFSVFGFTLKVQAWFWLFLRGGTALLAYLVGRRLLPRGLALLPAIAVIAAPGALHKTLFQLTALLNIYFYLRYRHHPSPVQALLAGAVVGGGALFRVDVGVFGFLSFMVLLWLELLWDRPSPGVTALLKRTASFMAGAALITLPVIAYFMVKADMETVLRAEWHRTAVVSGFAATLEVPGLSRALAAPWPYSLKFLLLGFMIRALPLAYVALAAGVVFSRFRKGSLGLEALALVAFGLPLLNQVRITPTFNHLLHAAPPAFIAWAVFIAWLKARPFLGRAGRAVLLAVLALSLGIPVFYNLVFTRGVLPGSLMNRFEFTEPVLLERAGIYETPADAAELERIVRYVTSATEPGDALFSSPFSPVINFLSKRPPAVRFLEPFYYFGSDELQRLMVDDLERTRPPVILLAPSIAVGKQTLERDAPLLYAYIKQNYSHSSGDDACQIWVRR